jgi:hypothetical protein
VSYTPSNLFTFGSASYIPGGIYAFAPADGFVGTIEVTLEGVTAALAGAVINDVEYTPSAEFLFLPANYFPDKGFLFTDVETLNEGVISAALDGVFASVYAAMPNEGVIDVALAGVVGEIVAVTGRNLGEIAVVLSGISGGLTAEYDVNVPRLAVVGICVVHEAAAALSCRVSLVTGQADFSARDICAPTADALQLPSALCAPVDQNTPLPANICVDIDKATQLFGNTAAPSDVLTRLDLNQCSVVDRAVLRFADVLSLLDQLIKMRPSAFCHPVEDAGQAIHVIHEILPAYRLVVFAFQVANYSPSSAFVFADNPSYATTQFFPEVELTDSVQRGVIRHYLRGDWQSAAPAKRHQCYTVQDASRPPPGTSIPVDPPPPPPPPPPEGHETLVIPTQSSYTMQHVISVVTLIGNVAVPVSKVNLALSADAFAWQFSAILADPGALSLVDIVDNEPVKLKITIDGYIWHTIVEEIEHSREFGKQAITLKGRGLSALLGVPYEQPKSNAYGSNLTVQQLADMQLPVDWTLNWTQETWLVPANAWSYTNQTPIQALAGIANDTGSMLVPARDAQSLTMMPRYPYWPWDFAGATPDLVIPEAAIKSLSLRPRLGTQANGVYVHGGDVGGVLGWCRFNGTDGARLAETCSNNLMTDVIGCRALGSRILAGQYTQPIVKSLTTYLDGDVFPLAEIGMLAAITIGAETERGIINSVAIEATLSSVSQTIQIGEETPNVWALFKELLPRDPLLVGTLASTDGATSIMTLLDGGVISVRGTGTVGNKYYIRAGRIEGEAPTMVQQEIVV